MTVPNQDFTPPSFGIAFTKKQATTTTAPTQPTNFPPSTNQPKPQAYGPARLVSSDAPVGVSHYITDVLSSPATQRAQTMARQARPGSVFIPRRSPSDRVLTEPCSTRPSSIANVTTSSTVAPTSARPKVNTSSRVRFASPTEQTVEVSPGEF